MSHQPDLIPAPLEDQVAELHSLLAQNGWMTRRAIGRATGWNDRTVRKVAEAAGSDVVRGPRGFALFGQADKDQVNHAAEIALSQARKMMAYATELKRRLHASIG